MRFYKQQHQFYCGIDLHARNMYVCIIDQKGNNKLHKNITTEAEMFFELIFPFMEDIVRQSFLIPTRPRPQIYPCRALGICR